jgi:hypothetical protein
MATAARSGVKEVNFGDLSMYVAGGGLPEGDYIIKDASVLMYQAPANQTTGKQAPARLGVMLTLIPFHDTDKGREYDEEKTQFYSLGTKAHESFAPNPETGKGVVAVPGGPATTFNNSTNWAIFLKSLRDSGMPEGTFTNDSSVLEGIHAHFANIPEPTERAGFQAKTGEAAEERKAGTIAVVTEIKDDGKPWEGSGGIPDAEAPAPAKASPKANPKGKVAPVAAKPATPSPKVATVTTASPTEADEDVLAAASSAVAAVLEKNPKGCAKLILRTGTFKAVNEAAGAEVAQVVINTYFSDDASLNGLLGEMGFALKGTQVVPA